MITHGILRVWSQVGLSCQLLAASIINIKQPVATAERYAPITPYPAERLFQRTLSFPTILLMSPNAHAWTCCSILSRSFFVVSPFPEGRLKHWRRKTETL